MLLIEKKVEQIMIIGTSNLQSLNKKKQKRRVVLNKSIYKNLPKSLIEI